jgi:hypothetical protein
MAGAAILNALVGKGLLKSDSDISTVSDEFMLIALGEISLKTDLTILKFFALRAMPFDSMLSICNKIKTFRNKE